VKKLVEGDTNPPEKPEQEPPTTGVHQDPDSRPERRRVADVDDGDDDLDYSIPVRKEPPFAPSPTQVKRTEQHHQHPTVRRGTLDSSKDQWRLDRRVRMTVNESSLSAYLIRSGVLGLGCVVAVILSPSFADVLVRHSHAPFGMLAAVWRWPGQADVLFLWAAIGAALASIVVIPLCILLVPIAVATDVSGSPVLGAVTAGLVAAILPPVRKIFPVAWIMGRRSQGRK
jgi:hypothetical protein